MQRRRRHLVAGALAMLVASFGPLASPISPARAADPVLVGAGDIADCATGADSATARLLDAIPGTVVTLGDNAYPSGTSAQFRDCYGPTWGRHRARTRPAPGNHDYRTTGAAGYFGYFGSAAGPAGRGYYSFDLGTWHIVSLDSECGAIGGCGTTSPEGRWLATDLAAHRGGNILAYWHHPRFSSGVHGSSTSVQSLWQLLFAAGADVVLNGHDHDYERFAPQDPWGHVDTSYGIREFVVGTGGTGLRGRGAAAAHSETFSSTHGVLRLTLHPDSYDWSFVPVAGSAYRDSGSARTHGAPIARTTASYPVIADATVDQSHPRTNLGRSSRLIVDGDVGGGLDRRAYLKVRVANVAGTVVSAALHVWVRDGTRDGPRAYRASTAWTETAITWRNQPGRSGRAASDAGRRGSGTWARLDVTAIVRGNGTYGFVLVPTSGDGLVVDSRQGAHPPRLVVSTTGD